MNTHRSLINGFFLTALLISTEISFAQSTNRFRFEAEAGAATLNLPRPYRTGGLYRQQLTGYFSPRWGVALGLSWGSSANTDPLKTTYTGQSNTGINSPHLPDPVALRSFYQRSEQMTDLTAVFRPLLTRRHQMKVQLGLSAYRRRELGVDSVRFMNPNYTYFETVGKHTDTQRLVPMVSVSYDYQLSARWAVGLSGTAYFTSDNQPTTSLGLRAVYRFNLPADSLGIHSIPSDAWRIGVRSGTTLMTLMGNSPGRVYRARFTGGLWAELPLSLTWAIRGEINYAQRGYRIKETPTSTGTYLSAFGNLNYLDLPLLVRYEAAYKWHVYGGPYVAFFLNGYTETAEVRNPPIKPHTVSGLAFGSSYQLTKAFAIDARYTHDIILLSTSQEGDLQGYQVAVTWLLR